MPVMPVFPLFGRDEARSSRTTQGRVRQGMFRPRAAAFPPRMPQAAWSPGRLLVPPCVSQHPAHGIGTVPQRRASLSPPRFILLHPPWFSRGALCRPDYANAGPQGPALCFWTGASRAGSPVWLSGSCPAPAWLLLVRLACLARLARPARPGCLARVICDAGQGV